MDTFFHTNRLQYSLGATLLGLLLILLALEGWRYGIKPSPSNNEEVITENLTEASNFFLERQQELLDNTNDLAQILRSALLKEQSLQSLNNILNQFPQFWSSTLYKNNTPLAWDGFALQKDRTSSPSTDQNGQISLKQHNNILYWECLVSFTIQDNTGNTSYTLVTNYRIQQNNPLPIGDRNEFNLFSSSYFSPSYPLNFSIFSSPPNNYVQDRTLKNLSGDSVGVVYATADKFQERQATWEQDTRFWRSVFAFICFLMLAGLLFRAAEQLPLWKGLLLQLSIIGLGWAIITITDVISYWVLALSDISGSELEKTVKLLAKSYSNGFLALLTSITIVHKTKQTTWYNHRNRFIVPIIVAMAWGLASTFLILGTFDLLLDTSIALNIPLLDLSIFPGWQIGILYITLGAWVLALLLLLINVTKVLLRIAQQRIPLVVPAMASTGFAGIFFVHFFFLTELSMFWVIYIGTLGLVTAIVPTISEFRQYKWMTEMSPLRKIVITSFVIAALCIPIFREASVNHTDNRLMKKAKDYSQKEDPRAEKITRNLLTTLEETFSNTNKQNLIEDQARIQTHFSETIQEFLSPEWNIYSFDIRFLDTEGQQIADYSTNLNSPAWLQIYNIPSLEVVTEMEQITKSTIRPVVQQPQLINQQDYRTFYRGWIPVFGQAENDPIGWIICSIYQERPQFNKPIRAVMASITYENWNSQYLLQKYSNGKLVNSVTQGITNNFPQKQTLTSSEKQALKANSVIFYRHQTADYNYRTLLWQQDDQQVIKATTPLFDYRVILFSFFRFSLFLSILGCILGLLYKLTAWKRFSFWGPNTRFQDRILDSFLLATLIFLAALIAVSHYTIKEQNRDIVRQELFDKLKTLTSAIESDPFVALEDDETSFSLDTLTTPLNADATFYAKRRVTQTTTPQIYQQHLLPSALPYDVYHQLFIEHRKEAFSTVNLAGQPLLIGYRTINDNNQQPIATLAIPTFLESPVYDQQLLQTTSYLILIYLLVFGIFIFVSAAIAKKLTYPLTVIRQGLNKISAGNLDTSIPVTSDDEFGQLASTYNRMVDRLKNLQEELAVAEREAAWKEMAQQVAHEIKNPLTPMKLNIQHLERQLNSDHQNPEELKENVQKITQNLIEQIQSLNNIASDFSTFSQPLSEDFEKVNLAELLSSVVKLYEHDETVDIIFSPPAHDITVPGINDELKRVIINLVKNAYESMPNNGGEITLQLYSKQNHAFIEIEDNGSGIPEEVRSDIFVPSFSTKSSGTGLGLAISKKIIEAHKGNISFASIEGKGTTFIIKLPEQ
ncbi:His Kinase A (phospho-acceptor) domain-containing protein [Fodinibius salinus]|uniref:histidine kinase n=1 Tax=Fodinibius salinus TaxID=860790 RepID=A0A5D3YKP0_9BACT|nr:HAMP domain-containing sensor histidine kinase [Fodinibius salinus]TYP94122.1 His Kinase A (phospho-acceptor) domain-containing protein [Fodinibius salinus]